MFTRERWRGAVPVPPVRMPAMLSVRTVPDVPDATDALGGLTILQRGWLSSNNVLIHGTQGEPGAWLIDTGHACHAEQTIALVDQALAGLPLAGILNTHLHNDHCGGNAALQRHFGLRPWVPQSRWQAVQQWDMDRLGHSAIGHDCPRFDAGGALAPGESLRAGGRDWLALAAPGHDPDSLVLFEPQHRVLISADALWHNGFGLVFPELIGEPGFADVAATLDMIEALDARCVIPGHGAPFTDVGAALGRARSKLAYFQAEPERHARHAIKALLKYRLMELRREPLAALVTWAQAAPWLQGVIATGAARQNCTAAHWCETVVGELVAAGQLSLDSGIVSDA